jgi:YVTN family beta-propeller protein
VNVRYRCRLWPLVAAVFLIVVAGSVYPQTVEDSIDVPGAWVGSLVYNPMQDEVWGGTWSGSYVFVINADSNRVVASIPLHGPFLLACDSADNKIYISYQGVGQDSLAVIDCASYSVIKRIEMPGATMPVWDPLSNRLYVSCQYDARVAVVDCATDSILMYIPVGACPMKMYVNTLRRKLYVLNYDAGSVSVVNMLTNQLIKTVVVGGNPNAGYYSRSADKFYSAGQPGQCVVLGGVTDTIIARIPLPGTEDIPGATGNETGAWVYLGTLSGHDDYVASIDARGDSVLATGEIGREPFALAYSEESGLLYCTSSWSDEVVVLTSDGRRVVRTLSVGNDPFVFTQAPRHRRLYLGHLGGTFVYVLRDTAAGICEAGAPEVRHDWALSASPNPFSGALRIEIATTVSSVAERPGLLVCSTDGRVVRKLSLTWGLDGRASAVWDGLDADRNGAPRAVYVLKQTGSQSALCKVVKTR